MCPHVTSFIFTKINLREMRKKIISIALLSCLFSAGTYAQVTAPQGGGPPPGGPRGPRVPELRLGPESPSAFNAWLTEMKNWRQHQKDSINYDNKEYKRAEFGWTAQNIIQTQMMIEDRYFFDPKSGKYTVDRYLDDLIKRYGGIQSVLIWPTYPNIGIDDRNQYDKIADMPGGIPAIKQMIADFHRRGVKVLFPIMVWDNGSRDVGLPMAEALTKLMAELGADGLNGDTMAGVTEDYYKGYLNTGHPLALQPEGAFRTMKMIEWNTMSWGYWQYKPIPGVSAYKWMEPRHMVNVNRRWATDKTDDIQYSFFNGVGYTTWENIWGIWNGIPRYYAESVRRTSKILRQFSKLLPSTEWEPHTPVIQQSVFASKFPEEKQTLWTFINRSNNEVNGRQIQLPFQQDLKYFDLWNGVELTPERDGDKIYLSFPMEQNGYGAILASKQADLDSNFKAFIKEMNTLSKIKLNALPKEWKPISQTIIKIPATKHLTQAPNGMVVIPGAKTYNFESTGVMIEGNELPTAIGVQYPWDNTPARAHKKEIEIKPFYMDRHPVTNAEYKKFMFATSYKPKDDHNFLKDWVNGIYPEGWANKPVTWVSIDDARAYAKWAGKRLPHEWEWQYAAQGTDGRTYPWGNTADSTLVPAMDKSRKMREPSEVNLFPKDVSPLGIRDLVGNVWQWTDEYSDEHTRSAILKGGSYYQAQGSRWYFPQAHEVNKYAKYLLMSDGRDRARTIGFRCVAD
jgi:iron(II)-dependent oxidoreductase